jgi:hypothetical protein
MKDVSKARAISEKIFASDPENGKTQLLLFKLAIVRNDDNLGAYLKLVLIIE